LDPHTLQQSSDNRIRVHLETVGLDLVASSFL
jgi:hypothetical protein